MTNSDLLKKHADELRAAGAEVVSILATWPGNKTEQYLTMDIPSKKGKALGKGFGEVRKQNTGATSIFKKAK